MSHSLQQSIEIPKQNHLLSQFYEAIFDSFQNYNLKNAVFLAERLRYIQENENNLCLLAECYLADNSPFKAYSVLKQVKGKRARFLFATAALRVNKLAEAEMALLPETNIQKGTSPKIPFEQVVNGAHGLYLLGQISERLGKKQQALECYEKAYQKNICLFAAFEKINQLSMSRETTVNALTVLKAKGNSQNPGSEITHSVLKNFLANGSREKENTVLVETFSNKKNPSSEGNFFHSFQQKLAPKTSGKTVNLMAQNQESVNGISSSMKKGSPKNKKRMNEYVTKQLPVVFSEGTSLSGSLTNSQFIQLGQTSSSVIQQGVGQTTILTPESTGIREYLATIGAPYYNLLSQNILQSLDEFKQLRRPMDSDPWVLANIGRCYTEVSNHVEAEKHFKLCFEKEPHRTENADYYSSCLWQLKRQIELPKFAFAMLENHYFTPETWIAHANCYSLVQDHDSAITYLLRATQIDPFNSYANCLIGHEYVNKENFEKAREFYQKAIKLDPKNVRALFGLGSLELNAGKFQESIDNFANAIKINNQCSTFYTQLGIAHKQRKNYEEALHYFNKAEEINESEKINRFNKADVLFKLGKFTDALRECRKVLNEAKESTVYFLLGQIYQKLGDVEEAHTNFELAIKMDKKEASKIKQVISTLEMREQKHLGF